MIQKKAKLYIPHPAQELLHNCPARFRVAPCGRRFGKTLGCLNEALRFLINRPESVSWWVAPTFQQAEIAYDMLLRCFPPQVIKENSRTRHRVILCSDSFIEFKSGYIPDNLRGEGLDLPIMDECAIMPRPVWEECLRPSLADRRGKAIFIGTPKGRNWFYEIYQRGLEENKEWASFNFPSWLNPVSFPGGEENQEIINLKKAMPEDLFHQEIAAEFLNDSAGVFRHIQDCINGPAPDDLEMPLRVAAPHPEHTYVAGLDLARLTDFTVLIIIDRDEKRVVYFDRFNEIDWTFQIRRLVPAVRAYNDAALLADKTGIGDVLFEELRKADLNVQGVTFTAGLKADLVQALAVSIERQEISFPDIKPLLEELSIYSYEMLPTGGIRYGAPEGYHDDCVIALALANWKMRGQVTWEDFPQVEAPLLEGDRIE